MQATPSETVADCAPTRHDSIRDLEPPAATYEPRNHKHSPVHIKTGGMEIADEEATPVRIRACSTYAPSVHSPPSTPTYPIHALMKG
jgi:hypothetical protein